MRTWSVKPYRRTGQGSLHAAHEGAPVGGRGGEEPPGEVGPEGGRIAEAALARTGLARLAVRSDHGSPGHVCSDRGFVVASHYVQAEVQPGGNARAGQDRALVPQHLRAVLDEYAACYDRHRPHRGRNLRPPDCDDFTMAATSDLAAARLQRWRVLGGLINEYERAA
jgi:hypothetical protein